MWETPAVVHQMTNYIGVTQSAPIGVIDIGSNSVRMVVYEGGRRSPFSLFNEKVLCGLGADLAATGCLPEPAVKCAIEALGRFAHLAKDMQLAHLDVVATSAVRDAKDGAGFVALVRQTTGLSIRVLNGEEEALYAARGVLSGTPEADGVVGDLGGGSLELVHVSHGQIYERTTLPIGLVRLLGDQSLTPRQRSAKIRTCLQEVEWLSTCAGKPVYLVGGAWRTLVRLEMQRMHVPIPVVHHYVLSLDAVTRARVWTKALANKQVRKGLNVSDRRIPTLPLATEVLSRIMAVTGSKEAIASAMGLREGLLYDRLSADVQAKDPFLDACMEMARRQSRFPEHGNILMRWLDTLFAEGESLEERRTRYGICLTSDIGWRAHPDYRAEASLYESLYGWFVGVDMRARAMMGLALYICYGGSVSNPNIRPALMLLNDQDKRRAIAIGQALRLAQRLSGGTATPLADSMLAMEDGKLVLCLNQGAAPLLGEVIMRRLRNLSTTLSVPCDIKIVTGI